MNAKQGWLGALAVLCAVALGQAAAGENWGQWRGPQHNGSSPDTGLPASYNKAEALWRAELPGDSCSTPVIWGDRIYQPFGTYTKEGTGDLGAVCLSRTDGKVLWQKTLVPGANKRNSRGTDLTSGSAATDGSLVVFLYGSGHVVVTDPDGTELWKKDIAKEVGPFALMWLYSSSALLHDGKVYVPVIRHDTNSYGVYDPGTVAKPWPSLLLCYDAKTGKELFRHVRPTDAVNETKESFATPVPYTHNGKTEILLQGAGLVTSHDPNTGAENWRFGKFYELAPANRRGDLRNVPSAVAAGGIVLGMPAKRRGFFTGYKLGGTGDITDTHKAWSIPKEAADVGSVQNGSISPDVCTPLVYGGHLYVLEGEGPRGKLHCVKPETGEILWTGQLTNKVVYWGSPTAADGKIFCLNETGVLTVVAADPAGFKELGKYDFDEAHTYASVAIAQSQVFVRTGKALYCFGKK